MQLFRLGVHKFLVVGLMCLPRIAGGQDGIIVTVAGMTPIGGPPVRGFAGDGGASTGATLALANM